MKVSPIDQHPQTDVAMEGASDVRMRMLVGAEDGATNFHMRHFEIAPGGFSPHHQHDYEHEVLVLSGEGVVKSEQGDRPISRDDVVFVPAGEMHQFVNKSDQPLTFICLIPAQNVCAR